MGGLVVKVGVQVFGVTSGDWVSRHSVFNGEMCGTQRATCRVENSRTKVQHAQDRIPVLFSLKGCKTVQTVYIKELIENWLMLNMILRIPILVGQLTIMWVGSQEYGKLHGSYKGYHCS